MRCDLFFIDAGSHKCHLLKSALAMCGVIKFGTIAISVWDSAVKRFTTLSPCSKESAAIVRVKFRAAVLGFTARLRW